MPDICDAINPLWNDESEAFRMMKFIIEHTTDIILIIGGNGVIEFANSPAYTELGYSLSELREMNIFQIDPQLTPFGWTQNWERLKDHGSTFTERLFVTKSGRELPVEIRANFFRCKDKELNCAIVRSILERKKTEQEIENNNLRYKLLAEHSTDMVTRHLSDGTCIYASPSCERIIGYRADEIVGHTNFDFITEEDIPLVRHVYPQIMNNPGVITVTYRIKHKNGGNIWVETTCHAIKTNGGDIKEVYATTRDISERKAFEAELIKAREKAIESDRLKTAFLQNMSHEIRTPINAILGFSDILPQSFDNINKLRRYSEIISQRSQDLLAIINDVLDIAHIESGQLKLKMEIISIDTFLNELRDFYAEHKIRMQKQHVEFELTISDNLVQTTILTDPVKLRQILINLISNAFKFTSKGRVEAGCFQDKPDQLVFYVADTGIGIPEDKFGYIFERFAQVNIPGNKIYGGTGLGLSIVKGLVELLGGKVWLNSQPDKGTTFYFTVPLNQ